MITTNGDPLARLRDLIVAYREKAYATRKEWSDAFDELREQIAGLVATDQEADRIKFRQERHRQGAVFVEVGSWLHQEYAGPDPVLRAPDGTALASFRRTIRCGILPSWIDRLRDNDFADGIATQLGDLLGVPPAPVLSELGKPAPLALRQAQVHRLLKSAYPECPKPEAFQVAMRPSRRDKLRDITLRQLGKLRRDDGECAPWYPYQETVAFLRSVAEATRVAWSAWTAELRAVTLEQEKWERAKRTAQEQRRARQSLPT